MPRRLAAARPARWGSERRLDGAGAWDDLRKDSSAHSPARPRHEIRHSSRHGPANVAEGRVSAHPADAGGWMSEQSEPEEAVVADGGDRRLRPLLVGVLLTIVVSGVVGLILDAPDSWRSFHVLYELALIMGSLA